MPYIQTQNVSILMEYTYIHILNLELSTNNNDLLIDGFIV